ncbi:MAG: AraC family transcriptional regulator [Gammaproteobacteria bacterium]|nr:MAG: AraC family transcriptional regulator [Gammaproteobacteria bacterium]
MDMKRLLMAVLLAASLGAGPLAAEQSLDTRMQDLRQEILHLNRELFMLEEDLLFPANTQVAVFLSMDVGEFFALDSVELKLNDRVVKRYLYTPREVEALLRGGVQQLYLGNLRSGSHELVAVFTGKGPHDRDYRRATSLNFEKGIGAQFVELKISDRVSRQQPEFLVREWD